MRVHVGHATVFDDHYFLSFSLVLSACGLTDHSSLPAVSLAPRKNLRLLYVTGHLLDSVVLLPRMLLFQLISIYPSDGLGHRFITAGTTVQTVCMSNLLVSVCIIAYFGFFHFSFLAQTDRFPPSLSSTRAYHGCTMAAILLEPLLAPAATASFFSGTDATHYTPTTTYGPMGHSIRMHQQHQAQPYTPSPSTSPPSHTPPTSTTPAFPPPPPPPLPTASPATPQPKSFQHSPAHSAPPAPPPTVPKI